jgi:hypothetical protein
MPYRDGRSFSIEFDFLAHQLIVSDCERERVWFALEAMTVAAFYSRLMEALRQIDVTVSIYTKPSEIADGIPFERDTVHKSYDRDAVQRFFNALIQADRLCKVFRADFLGKASPVHFFWGSFDLAVTRFSGRRAPEHPGGVAAMPDWVTREAYSHEEHSVGFWPGGSGMEAIFYAYAYPEPEGFSQAGVVPSDASWNTTLKEFVLPYEAVRASSDPDAAVLSFFRSTYEAAALLGTWDRQLLERDPGTSHDSKSKLNIPTP